MITKICNLITTKYLKICFNVMRFKTKQHDVYIFSIEFESERLFSTQFITRSRSSKDTLIEINVNLHTVVKTMMSVVIINDRPGEH